MPNHKKELVEWIGSIAAKNGHKSWRKVFNHGNNSSLKSKRKEPNLLVPGDIVYVPPVTPKDESGGTEKRHWFRLSRDKEDKFQIRLTDADMYFKAFGAINYRLEIGSQKKTGQLTKSDEVIEIPLGMEEETGEFELDGYVIQLQIGALEPHDRVSGLQTRIINLGFDPGPIDNIAGKKTERGIKDFQQHYSLPVNGKHDSATMNKVKSIYGC